eukprot:scaffold5682_cov229-Pinguiococcus_pyrenoidosus.AAC.4
MAVASSLACAGEGRRDRPIPCRRRRRQQVATTARGCRAALTCGWNWWSGRRKRCGFRCEVGHRHNDGFPKKMKNRVDEAHAVEKAINELQGMFGKMAALISQQGEVS